MSLQLFGVEVAPEEAVEVVVMLYIVIGTFFYIGSMGYSDAARTEMWENHGKFWRN